MVFDPCTSWAIVGALIDQVVPPSSEYSTLAPLSMLVSVSAGLLVMWSLLDEPVSLVSATPGAAGAVSSTVRVCFASGAWLPTPSDTSALMV